MILYLDASSLIKLYVEEQHSSDVRGWVEATHVATSRVAFAEVLSAFARRRDRGDLDLAGFERVLEAFTADWPDVAQLDVDERLAGELAVKHRLRALDAVHLAAALELRGLVGHDAVAFSSFDAFLQVAAWKEGLDTIQPEGWGEEVMEPAAEPYVLVDAGVWRPQEG